MNFRYHMQGCTERRFGLPLVAGFELQKKNGTRTMTRQNHPLDVEFVEECECECRCLRSVSACMIMPCD